MVGQEQASSRDGEPMAPPSVPTVVSPQPSCFKTYTATHLPTIPPMESGGGGGALPEAAHAPSWSAGVRRAVTQTRRAAFTVELYV